MTGSSKQTSDRKVCVTYGRPITWRHRWARNWDEVRYCSRACRRGRGKEVDRRLEETIVALLNQRRAGASICPSEAARAIAENDGWRTLMEPARRAARRLAHRGTIEITQRGRVTDPCEFRGPIRLRLTSDWGPVGG